MSLSIRDQLLAAGLGTQKQAKQIEHQQGRENWRNREGLVAAKEKRAADHAQAQAAKAARAQALNRKRQEEAERRSRWAQIKELIAQHAIVRPESDECFNFIDRRKVRRLHVNAELRERIISGNTMIVRCEGRYHLVPAETAARIAEREAAAVVLLNQGIDEPAAAAEDDPYKDFAVPDDLKW